MKVLLNRFVRNLIVLGLFVLISNSQTLAAPPIKHLPATRTATAAPASSANSADVQRQVQELQRQVQVLQETKDLKSPETGLGSDKLTAWATFGLFIVTGGLVVVAGLQLRSSAEATKQQTEFLKAQNNIAKAESDNSAALVSSTNHYAATTDATLNELIIGREMSQIPVIRLEISDVAEFIESHQLAVNQKTNSAVRKAGYITRCRISAKNVSSAVALEVKISVSEPSNIISGHITIDVVPGNGEEFAEIDAPQVPMNVDLPISASPVKKTIQVLAKYKNIYGRKMETLCEFELLLYNKVEQVNFPWMLLSTWRLVKETPYIAEF